MKNHISTPLPWRITGASMKDYEGAEIGTSNKTVCVILTACYDESSEEERANAELITTSVNHHEELIEALKACAEQVRLFMELHDDDEDAPLAYDKAQAVLTKMTKS